MTQPINMINPVLTRVGLNRLFTLSHEQGLQSTIASVSLVGEAFTANADMTELPSVINNWPCVDGEQISATQYNTYFELPYDGDPCPVYGIGWHLSDGTLFAVYSAPEGEIEAWLMPRVNQDAFYHLVLDAVPPNSLRVENTGIRFNPGLSELYIQIAANQLNFNRELMKMRALS